MQHITIKLSIVHAVEITVDTISNPDFERGKDDASRGIPYDQLRTVAWQTGWVAQQYRSNPKHARPIIMAGNNFDHAIEKIRAELRTQ